MHRTRWCPPARTLGLILLLLRAGSAGAQTLPAGPVSLFEGQLAVGAEVTATFGAVDEDAFFNYTDYEHNVLRMFRLGLSAAWRPSGRLALVGEVRSEDLDQARPYAAYIRVRPWPDRAFDIQAGRIPPVFGAYGRRAYINDNPVVGYPLAYQYLTVLRPDAIPATPADLLRMRARGWRVSYPVGQTDPGPGLPLISAFQWDTGVQAQWSTRVVDVSGAVTVGTLSDPRFPDNNGGKQVSARIGFRPVIGLVIGGSAARGAWLDRDVEDELPTGTPGSHAQTALGLDAEFSRGYWLVRSELVWSRWNMPFAQTGAVADLDAMGTWVEGRYRITPRFFVGARADRLAFSKLRLADGVTATWDANVVRLEGTGGCYIQRNLVARLTVQYNDRDGGRVRRRTYLSGQLSYWF